MRRSPPSSDNPDLDSADRKVSNLDQTMSYDEASDFDELDIFDDDNISLDDPLEKQRAALQVYLDSVPYQCESLDQMQIKLESIIEKIIVCAHSKNWVSISHWDGLLQWFVHLATVSQSLIILICWQLVDDAVSYAKGPSI